MPPHPDEADPQQQMEFDFMGRLSALQRLGRNAEKLAAHSRAANTVLAYSADWRRFSAWCKEFGRQALPASAATVALYVSEFAGAKSASTVVRWVAAIAAEHRRAGHVDPTKQPPACEVIAGIRRTPARGPSHAKAAVTVPELRRMVRAARKRAAPWGARDAAILLVGFAGGFRRSELVSLELADVGAFSAAGVMLHLRRSKTDQESHGRAVAIARGAARATCPVRALKEWIRVRGAWPGPLFCPIAALHCTIQHRRLSDCVVWGVVKRAASAAGLDAAKFGAHSLRAGLVTAAHESGASDSAIMSATGHKSVTTLARYIRSNGSGAFSSCPSRGLL
jgi:site-specific recombinase XerD